MKPFIPDLVCLGVAFLLALCERWADKRGFGKIVGGVWKILVILASVHIGYVLLIK